MWTTISRVLAGQHRPESPISHTSHTNQHATHPGRPRFGPRGRPYDDEHGGPVRLHPGRPGYRLGRPASHGRTGSPTLTAVRRRLWVFLSLLSAIAVHAVLAGLDLIAWRTAAVPAVLLGVWLVLCRMMVRPSRDSGDGFHGLLQPAVLRRLSPAALALTAVSILAAWIAVNPMGEHPNEAVASTTAAETPAGTTPASQVTPSNPSHRRSPRRPTPRPTPVPALRTRVRRPSRPNPPGPPMSRRSPVPRAPAVRSVAGS